jgi:DNA mismatch endonuclease (patch repair protein)
LGDIFHIYSDGDNLPSIYLCCMADVHDKATRSYNMSQIKGKNTKPEVLVRKFLFSKGFRYRIHDKRLPGKPDIVLPKYKTVIFVNGCFWHGHEGCKYYVVPKTRTDWWLDKISSNRGNDTRNEQQLKRSSWQVITLWECELKNENILHNLEELVRTLLKDIS